MKIRLTRRRCVIVAIVAPLLLYCGLYLHFRLNHTFIHRAGSYAPAISDDRPSRSTNHFIEPGYLPDGPQIFGALLNEAVTTSGTNDMDQAEFEAKLQEVMSQVDRIDERRERLFLVFVPAAFAETLFWKVVDPNPLKRRNKMQNKASQVTSQ